MMEQQILNNKPRPAHTRETRPSIDWLGLLFPWTAVAVLALIFWFFTPGRGSFFWVCPLHRLTGLYCPGCGGQRALHALLHLRVSEALSQNLAAVVIVGPVAAYALVRHTLRAVRARWLPPAPRNPAWIYWLAGVLVLFGILRNLPFPPFDWLAP